jgi:hypothetical protein
MAVFTISDSTFFSLNIARTYKCWATGSQTPPPAVRQRVTAG